MSDLLAKDVLHLFSDYKDHKGKNKGYFVTCPFHANDKNPSLHIYDSTKTGEHRLMVKCFGCDVPSERILEFINNSGAGVLSESDLAQIASGKKKARKIAEVPLTLTNVYDYTVGTSKEVAYQILRYEPKTFKCRRPSTYDERMESGKDWVYSRPELDTDLLLYNMHLLDYVRASSSERYVFKLEGEGKCDLFTKHKLISTCNPFGATNGKFLPHFADMLAGMKVVIIPDNDITGYNHLYEVSELLLPLVSSLKVVVLPRLKHHHDDVKDWFNKYDGSKEELMSLVESAEELVGKDVAYIKTAYVLDQDSIEERAESKLNLSLLDQLIAETESLEFTSDEGTSEVVYSQTLITAMETGRAILESKGRFAGLCEMCFGLGYQITQNTDGYMAIIGATLTGDGDSSENTNTAIMLSACNHGIYSQNIDDFQY